MSSPLSQLHQFCMHAIPEFTPLGGSRPDSAVVACASMSLFTDRLPLNVVLPWDVLETALAFLCAPLIVTYSWDLRRREAIFRCPAVSVRLRTTDVEVLEALKLITDISCYNGSLSVAVELDATVTVLPDSFMRGWNTVTSVDLRRTSLQRVNCRFLTRCSNLTSVQLPRSLSEVSDRFLSQCAQLQHVDLQHTALQIVGKAFLSHCPRLTTVILPDSVTEVGRFFFLRSRLAEVTTGSAAVQVATAGHHSKLCF